MLGKIGPKSQTAVPALLEAIKEFDTDVRLFAVETLGSLKADAKKAIPALIEAIDFALFYFYGRAKQIKLNAGIAREEFLEAYKQA